MNDIILFCGVTYYKTTVYDILDNTYYVSKQGQIYNSKLKRLIKISHDKDGYERVHIRTNKGAKLMMVAKIVLATFYGYPPIDMIAPTCEHKDGVRTNNCIENLEWLERPLNISRRQNKPMGEKNPKNKLSEVQVREICLILQDKDMSLKEISEKYSVSKDAIRDIKNKRNWRYISETFNI